MRTAKWSRETQDRDPDSWWGWAGVGVEAVTSFLES